MFPYKITVSKWLPFHLALLFLMIPAKLLFTMILSVVIHEVSHLLAINLCKTKANNISIGITGARILTEDLTAYQELICAAAGPIGSFFVLLFAKSLPLLAVCSVIHGVFNLIPLGSMDGARILRSLIFICKDHINRAT